MHRASSEIKLRQENGDVPETGRKPKLSLDYPTYPQPRSKKDRVEFSDLRLRGKWKKREPQVLDRYGWHNASPIDHPLR